jgi:hypothetical protein
LRWEPFYSQVESILATFAWWEKFNTTTSTVNDLCISDINYFLKNVKVPGN